MGRSTPARSDVQAHGPGDGDGVRLHPDRLHGVPLAVGTLAGELEGPLGVLEAVPGDGDHDGLVRFDLAGLAVFAASGALAAAKRGQTFVTLVFFGLITGVGGGTVRDLLIGAPVFAIILVRARPAR